MRGKEIGQADADLIAPVVKKLAEGVEAALKAASK
jgi:hypothetical protein